MTERKTTIQVATLSAFEFDLEGNLVDQDSFVINLDSIESNDSGTASTWLGTVDGTPIRITVEEGPR